MPTSRSIPFQGEVLFPPSPPCDRTETMDLVIIDRMEEKMDIFELTVPLETNIKNANTQKMNNYEHFITNITILGMCLFTLWKSAQEDISNHQIKQIQRNCISSCKPGVSFKAMCENLSSLAVLSSYHIFRKRKTLDWDQETPFLKTISE